MEIFYINIEEFLNRYGIESLKPFLENVDFKSQKRCLEYGIGRFLLTNAAKTIYSIENPKIIINNKKPEFANKEIEFSLSHSKDYIIAAFDKNPCGIDLEYMDNNINLEKLSKRYREKFKSIDHFYQFWTDKEAKLKLQEKPALIFYGYFKDNYRIAVTSNKEFVPHFEIKNFLEML